MKSLPSTLPSCSPLTSPPGRLRIHASRSPVAPAPLDPADGRGPGTTVDRAGQRAGQQVAIPHPTFRLANGLTVHRPRGPQGAGRRGQHLVQCRLEGRAQGQDRLRPSVRASDVQRLGEPARRLSSTYLAADRRDRLQRHHLVRPHQLFPDRADAARSSGRCSWKATAWAICSARSRRSKLDNQRGVVQNEKRQGDNQPGGLVDYASAREPVPGRPSLSHSTIGSMADLDAASLADVKQWFRDKYGPNNAVLVLAGDIDAGRGAAAGREIFRRDPARPGQQSRRRPTCRRSPRRSRS